MCPDWSTEGLVFGNCIDFDMLYGHRNDPAGFTQALQMVDAWLGMNLPKLQTGDLMIFSGDHGVDPTTPSTDHSREYTPLLIFGADLPWGVDLGVRDTFADIAASLYRWFRLQPWPVGREFASLLDR